MPISTEQAYVIKVRDIAPDQIVVCMSRDTEDGCANSWYRQAVKRPYVSVGLLARIQFIILQESVPSA